jgi:hypothetical protein
MFIYNNLVLTCGRKLHFAELFEAGIPKDKPLIFSEDVL